MRVRPRPVIPSDLLVKAIDWGWRSDREAAQMFRRALATGFSMDQIGVALDMGLTPERAVQLLESARGRCPRVRGSRQSKRRAADDTRGAPPGPS